MSDQNRSIPLNNTPMAHMETSAMNAEEQSKQPASHVRERAEA